MSEKSNECFCPFKLFSLRNVSSLFSLLLSITSSLRSRYLMSACASRAGTWAAAASEPLRRCEEVGGDYSPRSAAAQARAHSRPSSVAPWPAPPAPASRTSTSCTRSSASKSGSCRNCAPDCILWGFTRGGGGAEGLFGGSSGGSCSEWGGVPWLKWDRVGSCCPPPPPPRMQTNGAGWGGEVGSVSAMQVVRGKRGSLQCLPHRNIHSTALQEQRRRSSQSSLVPLWHQKCKVRSWRQKIRLRGCSRSLIPTQRHQNPD